MKKRFVKKKAAEGSIRSVGLKKPTEIRSVLLISDSDSKSLKRKVEELFSGASVYHLFPRDIKEDRTRGFYYSVHPSDFNLTGNLKNDKLANLEKMPIELLLDLSSDSKELNFFVNRTTSELKVGNIYSNKTEYYDLLLEYATTEIQCVEDIVTHLNTLTNNAN